MLQVAEQSLEPLHAFYLSTLKSAKALYIDDYVGDFLAGKEADDFIILGLESAPTTTPIQEDK